MVTKKKSNAIPDKVVKLRRSDSAKKKIMDMYRQHVGKLRARHNPVQINQVSTVIGTDNTWFNADIIARDPAWVIVPNANYVWNARDLGSQTAIISNTFRISPRRFIRRAELFLSVDNYAAVFINGRPVVFDQPQNTPSFFTVGRSFNIRRFLRRGTNDIVIIAFNFGGPRSLDNPAGVAARLNIRLSRLF